MRLVRFLGPLILVLAAGCGGSGPVGQADAVRLDRETYITVLVELRVAARDAADPAEYHRRKQEILDRHGASDEDMMRFTEAHGGNVRLMAEIWDTVHARVEAALAASAETQ